MGSSVKKSLIGLINRQAEEVLLDKWTLDLVRSVYEKARQGLTMDAIFGYLGYRKRVAQGENKARVQRVIKSIRTNRWNVADDIEALQKKAEETRKERQLDRQIRDTWYMQQAEVASRIPPGKRGGRGGKSRSRKEDHKPRDRSAYWSGV